MSKHTPTPWHIVANLVQGPHKQNGDSRTVAMVGSGAEDDANAEFIVRACNSHEDLLAALEYIMDWKPEGWTAETARDMALAAIAKAKGGADA